MYPTLTRFLSPQRWSLNHLLLARHILSTSETRTRIESFQVSIFYWRRKNCLDWTESLLVRPSMYYLEMKQLPSWNLYFREQLRKAFKIIGNMVTGFGRKRRTKMFLAL